MIAMQQNGLDVRKVIPHRFPADRFEEGFAAMRLGQSGKVVLKWGCGPVGAREKNEGAGHADWRSRDRNDHQRDGAGDCGGGA